MRNYLLMTTLVAGLVTSLVGVADSDMDSCLAANSDKSDKMSICLDQLHQSMADTKKQELQQQYNQAVADQTKQQQELAKKQGGAAGNASGGSVNTAPSTPSTPTTTTPPSSSENTQNSNSSGDNSSGTSTTQQKSVNVKPVPREKPTGVQWY